MGGRNSTSKLKQTKLPRLTPAPYLRSHRNDVQTPALNSAISWVELYDQQYNTSNEMKQQLRDKQCELDCVRATLKATEVILKDTKSMCNQLKSDLSNSRAELAKLQVMLTDSETSRAQIHSEMINLQAKLVDAEADRELQMTELNDLRAKANSRNQNSPTTTTSKEHKCPQCDYMTTKSNRMKTHLAEGCRNATVLKNCSCKVCRGDFTRNGLRYHLNQYVKKSNQAKNGHQNVSPKQHREMLDEIKKTNL